MPSTAQAIIAGVPECPRGSRVIEDYVARVVRTGLTADMATLAVQASRSPRTEVRMMGALCCSHVESGDAAACERRGHATCLEVIRHWLEAGNAGMRRAVCEGLRPWTARSPFREQPALAVALLAPLHRDADESTRLSAAHALADISKKHPALVRAVISGWDIADPRIAAVARHAARHL
ncbi:DNA alkylation repair protein [Reyranella sp. CPCC 100927]|uniref:DNA alkylation repair protein n=1 Tax=Reyranella sp. CPCC 100927 TaxID=2599616 RepID=UPI0011B7FFE8|nr:DNA alkylation repair protein [Reyranella sp. CPCC 100927]TWT02838.1 hypothetical protein FQU96_29500 [Reyranella sp. CPCC 100927]